MFLRIVGGILGIAFIWMIIFHFPENQQFSKEMIYGLFMGVLFTIYAILGNKLFELFPFFGEIKKDIKPSISGVYPIILIGIVMILFGSWWVFKSYQAQSWHQVSGNILEAYCEKEDNGNIRRVKYEYIVADKKFINNRENIVNIVSDDCYSGYNKDQSVIVFYNPNDPKESVLINVIQPSAIIVLIIGLCLFAFGVYRINKLLRTLD